MTEVQKQMIEAVRSDPYVGRGSCTSIDECFEKDELLRLFDHYHAETPEEAVRAAYEQEGLFNEQKLNARQGEPDDPELIEYREWKQAMNGLDR